MKNFSRTIFVLMIGLLIVLTTSCVKSRRISLHKELRTKEIRVGVILEKNRNIDRKYQNFAVAKIEESITESDFMDYFVEKKVKIKLIDRNKLDYIMEEQSFQSSGIVNHKQLVKMGKIAGLQVVIIIDPVTISVEDFKYKEKKTYCTSRKIFSAIRISVLRIDTAQIIKTALYEEDEKKSQYAESGYRYDDLLSKEKMILKSLNSISEDFSDDLCEIL